MSVKQAPVLFLIYNRPEITRTTFSAIARMKPEKLYISADGPKDNATDEEKCRKTREIINAIDWDCDLQLNFSNKNLGCREAPIAGMNWLFSKEEYGIILEDDCVPSEDFLKYCSELLHRYRDDHRIMQISGNNLHKGWKRDKYSYYFSKYGSIHGWATWKRAWDLYDPDMTIWNELKLNQYYDDLFRTKREAAVFFKYWNLVYEKKLATAWDFQWLFAILVNNGLAVVPSCNLIRNIGFGEDATHTKVKTSIFDVEYEKMKFPLNAPPFVFEDVKSDQKYFEEMYESGVKNKVKSIIRRLKVLEHELITTPLERLEYEYLSRQQRLPEI